MNKKLLIIFAIGSLLSTATLYLAFRNVPLADLLAYLKVINYWWLLPTTAMVVATFVLRTFRWQIILKDAGKIGYWQAFHPLMIGFMMNCILPGRIGELARPVILKKERGIALTTGVATVVTERIFDIVVLISLLALLSGTITSQPNLDRSYFGLHLNSHTLVAAAWGMIRLSIALLIFIAIILFKTSREFVKRIISSIAHHIAFGNAGMLRRTEGLAGFVIKIIENFAAGLAMVRKPRRLLACTGLTLLIWATTALSYLVFSKGCPGVQLSLLELTTVMVVICFFIALPSVPGFWGLWEAAGVFALALFGVTEKDALGFTLVNHAAQLFPVIALGLVSALLTSVNIWQLSHSNEVLNNPESTA
jgi:glycosyltransferase 2 family protein